MKHYHNVTNIQIKLISKEVRFQRMRNIIVMPNTTPI